MDPNTALNLSVLRRHNHLITNIISTASYSVVYVFSASSGQWEKSGIEGSLFVVALAPENPEEDDGGYAIMVLNRQGLENFTIQLTSEEDVDVEEEIIQIRGSASQANGVGADGLDGEEAEEDENGQIAYGVWIYSEVGRSTEDSLDLNKRVIKDCARRARESRERRRMEAVNGGDGLQDVGMGGGSGYTEQDQQASWQGAGGGGYAAGDRYEPTSTDERAYQSMSPPQSNANTNGMGTMSGRQLSLLDLFGQAGAPAAANNHQQPSHMPPPGLQQPPSRPHPQQNGMQAAGLLDLFRRAPGGYGSGT